MPDHIHEGAGLAAVVHEGHHADIGPKMEHRRRMHGVLNITFSKFLMVDQLHQVLGLVLEDMLRLRLHPSRLRQLGFTRS